MSKLCVVDIARVCHEVNRAYCVSIGDDSQPPWENAPEWQKDSAIRGVEFHSSGDHGPSDSHVSWMKQKIEEGWVYGPIKDTVKKTHHSLVPYKELSQSEQSKDYIFSAIVKALNSIN